MTALDDPDLKQAHETVVRPALENLEQRRKSALFRFLPAVALGAAGFFDWNSGVSLEGSGQQVYEGGSLSGAAPGANPESV